MEENKRLVKLGYRGEGEGRDGGLENLETMRVLIGLLHSVFQLYLCSEVQNGMLRVYIDES